ncbi:hypothetical protein [Gehongia tenuis]|uniref:Uncharacterized protein n=1 Tax=Gehongia tenuis TaxID=2763655 RepID=A0A926D3K6_9FIRM|nr:hypothetical protein [Gehongia tenuis]MBC8530829.1 hypothetical protein [Gehongia tenuis]
MKKFLVRYLLPALLSMLTAVVLDFAFFGVPLFGMPEPEDVAYVEITNGRLMAEPKRVTGEDIELAVNLAGFLKFTLGEAEEEPRIEMVYHLKDGGTVSLAGGERSVLWKGRTLALKEDGLFVNLAEGIFFPMEEE